MTNSVAGTAGPLDQILADVRELDLESNVAALDASGFTVVEPERVAPPGFVDRVRDALLAVARSRNHTALAGETTGDRAITDQALHYLLTEGRPFEEAVMNPVALALISYLLGQSCVLSGLVGLIKGPSTDPLPLHTDNGPGMPEPFPAFSQVANATWLLSDYTRDNGALCFVPGSHRRCRHPLRSERLPGPTAVPIEAPAGSLVVWHGNLWHGAFPRTVPGHRLTLVMYFARMYLRPQESYVDRLQPAVLDRNPARLRQLLALDHPFPVAPEGADYRKVAAAHRAGTDVFG
jgi:ectoine hydroxylase-related dioxygenase (phytanoyl-CoA dioxygenase family)